jgi:hypothetical protein
LEKIIINDASSQHSRVLEALREGYIQVDEYTPEDLMAFAVEFSTLVNYFNPEDQVDGDWMGFFIMDNALLLSYIAATDIQRIEETFEKIFFKAKNAGRFEIKFGFLEEVFGRILFVARLFNLFLKIVNRQPVPEMTDLKQELVEIIKYPLSEELRKLKSYAEGASARNTLDKKIELPLHEFLPVWNIHHVPPIDSIYTGRTPDLKIDCALTYLRPVQDAFIYQLIFIKQFARRLLADALAGPHKPHVALYLTFLELFATARRNLNTITPRYRDFYYSDILRQKTRGYTPDKVFLDFKLAQDAGVTTSLIKKGTQFLAGADEGGQDILYAADDDLWLSSTGIDKVYTVFTQHSDLINYTVAPANEDCGCTPPPDPIRAVSGIYSGDFLTKNADGSMALPVNGFATLGNSRINAFNQYAGIGFTIASDTLLLTGGNRSVAFTFYLTEAAQQILFDYLTALQEATGKNEGSLLMDVLKNAFTIYLSTESNWLKIDKYEVTYLSPPESPALPSLYLWGIFTISFQLPSSAPAITALRNEETGAVEDLPMARFILRQGPLFFAEAPLIYVYPISFISQMKLREILINAEVKDFGNFSLSNNLSDIDATAPFNPFGSIPVRGSYLEISGGELFSKEISSLSLAVKWFDLPQNKDGFAGYYKYYALDANGEKLIPPIGNDSFRVKIYTVNPGSWELKYSEKDEDDPYLFSTDNQSLRDTTLFEALPVIPHHASVYYAPADGSIRIELNRPGYAFGNDLYPINLMNAVIQDLPTIPACEEACKKKYQDNPESFKECMEKCLLPKELKFPSPPYVPSATFLTAHYTCSATLSFDVPTKGKNKFYHIYPFGGYQLNETATPLLLPDFYEGNLILGLSGLMDAQSLNLLFSMSDPGNLPVETYPEICWSYLSDNRWSFLKSSDVLSDGTNNFRNTGIISLRIPAFSEKNNTLLSPDLKWIRASSKKNSLSVSTTLAIYPHALTATWQDNENTGIHLRSPLPAFTIREAVTDPGNIQKIIQPLESFGGRPAETYDQLTIRVGERLRHKQRALLPWDYERLILEQFPEIYKVKCLPHQTRDLSPKAGHVLVVVVAGPDSTGKEQPQTPIATQPLLSAVKNYLSNFISPFITLEVCNPVYVKIKVNCTVQFTQEAATGDSLDELNRNLTQYLSPWYYDQERETKAGYYISASDIAGFIQTRPYVAFLDTMELNYDPAPDLLETNWYFLTSADKHDIKEAVEKSCEP